MTLSGSSTAQKLLQSFIRFKKAGWNRQDHPSNKPSETMVLLMLNKNSLDDSGMMASELSTLLHVTPPTITQLINGLETNGLVERNVNPSDRRAVRITLTKRGRMASERAIEAFNASFSGLIEYLGEEESNQLADLLSKVNRYFDECGSLPGSRD